MTTDPLESLRRICLALPEVEERLSHGHPAWLIQGKKTFVSYHHRHHGDRLGFWCAAPEGAQEVLVGSDPERFFRPPGACPERGVSRSRRVGVRGWRGVYLDRPVDWALIEELVRDAYRTVAPKRLMAAMNAGRSGENERPYAPIPAKRPDSSQRCERPLCYDFPHHARRRRTPEILDRRRHRVGLRRRLA